MAWARYHITSLALALALVIALIQRLMMVGLGQAMQPRAIGQREGSKTKRKEDRGLATFCLVNCTAQVKE